MFTQFNYNPDIETRDTIIFGTSVKPKYLGGLTSFKGLTITQLQQLLDQKFIDPQESQNNSPNVAEFLSFARKMNAEGFECTFSGYAISSSRVDYRVSIEAIEFTGDCTTSLVANFTEFTQGADKVTVEPNHLSAWWD